MSRAAEPSSVQPVWRPAAAATAQLGQLRSEIVADVAVIGAGFVGLTAALELAAAGRSVVLLEAGDVASGASAASAGQVGPLLYGARKTPAAVIARLGAVRGERLNRLVAASGRRLFDAIAAHGIACEARRGYLCVYRSESGLTRALAGFAQWQRYGGRSERVSRDELARSINSARYVGGVFLPEGGFVDPALLLEGLAAAALRAGVAVHARSPAVAVDKRGGVRRVRTPLGSVTAADLLIATGVNRFQPWPELADCAYAVPCGVAATAPLADRGEALLPQGGPVADMEDKAIFAPAVTADGRLVVSFLITDAVAELATSPAPARRRLARAFPGRSLPAFETMSWGRIGLTPDGLPRLLRGPDGMLAVTGCNGLGLTLGITAAREAARLICGASPDSLALPVSAPQPLPGAWLVPTLFGKVLAPLANRLGA